MPEGLILEFSDIGQREYAAVNAKLGIDMGTGAGDWPDGLLVHTAGPKDDGGWVVSEVWSTREAQGAFMESRLGAALAAGGVTSAPEITWVSLVAYLTPGA